MNDKGVHRTAPATPGLLKKLEENDWPYELIIYNGVVKAAPGLPRVVDQRPNSTKMGARDIDTGWHNKLSTYSIIW